MMDAGLVREFVLLKIIVIQNIVIQVIAILINRMNQIMMIMTILLIKRRSTRKMIKRKKIRNVPFYKYKLLSLKMRAICSGFSQLY
jgi:hypothetical protein